MGIPFLTRHVRDYGETVYIGEAAGVDKLIPRITSVVIDGPSLVFHVYLTLRSCSDTCSNALEAQPTCEDVSVGVLRYLVHLLEIGVNIEGIYFDGALPLAKRATRLQRLEHTLNSFQLFHSTYAAGFNGPCTRSTRRQITPDCVFTPRATLSAHLTTISQTAFIVATVIEDLKTRWTADSIRTLFGLDRFSKGAVFDFKDRTRIVLGEADICCAESARNSGSSVLTQDSDLLIHDLGDASVIFLDSLALTESGSLLAREWRPSSIVKRLGVPSMQHLGFEIYRHRSSSLATIVQHSKSLYDARTSAMFASFRKEYDVRPGPQVSNPHIMDPRISELYAQYMLPSELDDASGAPHIYLPMLIEDYTRSAACLQGSDIRLAAYSIFNLSFPPEKRKTCVTEYMRRASSVAAVNVTLLTSDDALEYAQIVLSKIESIRGACDSDCLPIHFWLAFAVSDVFANNANKNMDFQSLERLLMTGCREGSLRWGDLHFQAQLHAVLYSVRIFRTLVSVALNSLEGERQVVATRCVRYMQHMPPVQATATAIVKRPVAARLAEIVKSVFEASSPELE
ncbi:hypothetical protein KEM54_001742 [Ascosphaera aggregata]|nr:hypothetical protein KEM54_001742 [Ascosphaera aggregata]